MLGIHDLDGLIVGQEVAGDDLPPPDLRSRIVFGPSVFMRTRTSLRFSTTVATSSITPGIVENSCGHAVDPDARDRRALKRGEEHAAERIAERRAEAPLERLAEEASVGRGQCVLFHFETTRSNQVPPIARDDIILHRNPLVRSASASIPAENARSVTVEGDKLS